MTILASVYSMYILHEKISFTHHVWWFIIIAKSEIKRKRRVLLLTKVHDREIVAYWSKNKIWLYVLIQYSHFTVYCILFLAIWIFIKYEYLLYL